jgi:hypothetical protein
LVTAHHGGVKFFNAVQSFEGINIKYEVLGHAAPNNGMHPTATLRVHIRLLREPLAPTPKETALSSKLAVYEAA